MKVVVDTDKCQDHGQCAFATPDVFSMDVEGHLVYVSEPGEALRDGVEEAADVCPLQAIRIED
ncbi:ferredoxin [Streptomyces sp. ICN441]|uniref:ferredoxin n=1 Tax=Streptomyces sp. ICN441 TaxID=2558286 RepID=UPI00106A3322|nr:ferredoxin [Streptomyces sp. ICN441]TFE58277.1 ferredoxin [Streptomyces sp. ICN441]